MLLLYQPSRKNWKWYVEILRLNMKHSGLKVAKSHTVTSLMCHSSHMLLKIEIVFTVIHSFTRLATLSHVGLTARCPFSPLRSRSWSWITVARAKERSRESQKSSRIWNCSASSTSAWPASQTSQSWPNSKRWEGLQSVRKPDVHVNVWRRCRCSALQSFQFLFQHVFSLFLKGDSNLIVWFVIGEFLSYVACGQLPLVYFACFLVQQRVEKLCVWLQLSHSLMAFCVFLFVLSAL